MNSTQPLFYRNPEPLDRARHKGLGVAEKGSFAFARNANTALLTLMEFALASRTYPIVFTAADEPMPVALLGLRNRENLFVNDGAWAESTYIPAYIRRYPFAFLESADKKTLTLCVDVDSDAVVTTSTTKFFEENGDPSEFTRAALEFCRSFQAQFNQTRELGALLKRHELLVSRQADITLPTGDRTAVRDFLVVDESRLNALGDDVFLEFRKAGLLPPIYFHLMSLANLRDLAERMARMSASTD
ncbi:MAG: SapC family protein [Hyphomicrobiaceae bacterium]